MNSVQLGKLCDIEMGQAPRGSSYNNAGKGYPLLAGAGDFGVEFPEPTKFTTEPTKVSRQDDILLCIRATIGDLNWSNSEFCLGRGVAGLRPKDARLDRRYLWRWLSQAKPELERRAHGSTFKQVSRKDIAELSIPLPNDLQEQRRIAKVLDNIDSIRKNSEAAIALADSFVISSFLKRFGHPLDPKMSPRASTLGEHCDFFAGNSLPEGEVYTGQEDGLFLLKVSDLNAVGNEATVRSAKLWLPSRVAAKGGVIAPRGAVVFPKRGGAIATNKKRVLDRDSALDPNLMAVAVKAGSHISNHYVRTWFELLDLSLISSGSSVPQLNKKDLSPLAFIVPDKEAIEWFDNVFLFVNDLRKLLRSALSEAESIFASTSDRAFRGDL